VAAWQDDSESVVRAAIRDWSDSLVNLTSANRLLKFRPSRTGTIEIVQPSAEEVLSGLVAKRTWRFRAIDPQGDADIDGGASQPLLHVLDTRKPEADLGAALRNLARRSTQEFLNRGLSVLYLAIELLDWTDEDDTSMASPLLLVPVELVRTGPRQPPVLVVGEEDAVINPALTLRMQQFGVALPTVDDLEDVSLPDLLGQVWTAVADQKGSSVCQPGEQLVRICSTSSSRPEVGLRPPRPLAIICARAQPLRDGGLTARRLGAVRPRRRRA